MTIRLAPRLRPVGLALLLLALAVLPARGAEPDTSAASLAPSSEPPWNPPGVLSPNEPWEAVVRFPGRLVSLPLAALGQGVRVSMRAAEQGFVLQKTLYLFRNVRLPLALGPADLGDRTGFGVMTGVGFPLGPAILPIEYQASSGHYTRFRTGVQAGIAALEYRSEHRPSDRFYGFGVGSREEDETMYGLLEERVRLSLALRSDVRGGIGPRESLELWAGPRWSTITRGYREDDPSIADLFPGAVAGTLDRQFEHLHYGARLGMDQTRGRPHWSHGWRGSASIERFDRPFAESPSRAGAQFTRVRVETEAGTSFLRDPRTLRLSVGIVDHHLTGGVERFLPSDLARLGGSEGVAGFEPQRFHDLDRVNARLAWIFPLSALFEFDVHADAGGVFGKLRDDFRFNRLRHSAGGALRVRTPAAVLGSAGLDVSAESARFVFSMGVAW